MQPPAIWAHFESLEDPRVERTRRHKLQDIVVISVMAVIGFADGWSDIVPFAKDREEWLRTVLELPSGIPSDDTFRRVMSALDPVAFRSCFLNWVRALMVATEGKLVAIDGKTVRRSCAREEGKSALHVVSAWVAHNQLVLGQVATDQKSNEITAIPELLGMLDLSGATVTIDAMGCQKKIAEAIVDAKADYVLTLKDNQPTLHQEVRDFFESAQADGWRATRHEEHETVHGEHGRIETRHGVVSDDIEWLTDRHLWKGLRSVVMIESTRTLGEESSFERRYYLSSLAPEAAVIAERIRGHWGTDNGLHWVLDMAFDEDRCRIRRGHGPDNFALLRKIAVNLWKAEKTCKRGIEGKRTHVAWNHDYLLKVLEAGASFIGRGPATTLRRIRAAVASSQQQARRAA